MNGDIGITIVLILTIMFIASFLYGKSRNLRRGNLIWRSLSKVFKEVFNIKKVGYRSFGSSGYQILISKPSGEIAKYEVTVIMMDRENIIHYIIQRIRGVRDMLVIKVDYNRKPKASIDIFNTSLKKVGGGESLKEYPVIKYKGGREGRNIVNMILDDLIYFKDTIISLSVSKISPHLVLTAYYDDNKLYNLILFTKDLYKVI